MEKIKKIYFRSLDGYYETLLVADDKYYIGTGTHHITDLAGRVFFLPVQMTLLKIEDWDGDTQYMSTLYNDIISELRGTSTGVITKNKK